MKYDYDECLKFINRKFGECLLPYQKDILKAFCDGKKVRTARGIGRSYVANLFSRYVESLYEKNDYSKEPDVVFTYECAETAGLLNQKFIDLQRSKMSPEDFDREYLCK